MTVESTSFMHQHLFRLDRPFLLCWLLPPLVSFNLLVFCLVEVLGQDAGEDEAQDVNGGHAEDPDPQLGHVFNDEVHHQPVASL